MTEAIERVVKQARRKPGNEAGLVFWMAASVICLTVYYFMMSGLYWFNPLGLNILGNSLLHALLIGGGFALAWYVLARGPIQRARAAHAAHLHAAEAERRVETARKIAEMKAKEVAG